MWLTKLTHLPQLITNLFTFHHFPLPLFCPCFVKLSSLKQPALLLCCNITHYLVPPLDPPPWRPPSPLTEECHNASGTVSALSHSGLSKRASQVTIGLPSPPNYSVALLLPHGSNKDQTHRHQSASGSHQGSHQGNHQERIPKPSAPPPDSLWNW